MTHPLQDDWDKWVIKHYEASSTANTTIAFLREYKIPIDENSFHLAIALLREDGLRRLPLLTKGEGSSWYWVFRPLPVSAWLARAIPGSVDLFHERDFKERVELFKRCKTKRLRKSSKGRAKRISNGLKCKGGASLTFSARERDKRRDWATVK